MMFLFTNLPKFSSWFLFSIISCRSLIFNLFFYEARFEYGQLAFRQLRLTFLSTHPNVQLVLRKARKNTYPDPIIDSYSLCIWLFGICA